MNKWVLKIKKAVSKGNTGVVTEIIFKDFRMLYCKSHCQTKENEKHSSTVTFGHKLKMV